MSSQNSGCNGQTSAKPQDGCFCFYIHSAPHFMSTSPSVTRMGVLAAPRCPFLTSDIYFSCSELYSLKWVSLLFSFPFSASNADKLSFSHLHSGHPREAFELTWFGSHTWSWVWSMACPHQQLSRIPQQERAGAGKQLPG